MLNIARAKHVLHRQIRKISDVLKRWSKDGAVGVSHFRSVRTIYAEYFFREHWDAKTSARDVRDEISGIKADTKILQSRISNLDEAALYVLSDVAKKDRKTDFDLDAPDHGWTEIGALEMSDVMRALETLSRWAVTALQGLDEPRLGPPPRYAEVRALRLLGPLYEELTGKRALTLTKPPEGGEERGAFRRFANDILGFISVKVTAFRVLQAQTEAIAEKAKAMAKARAEAMVKKAVEIYQNRHWTPGSA